MTLLKNFGIMFALCIVGSLTYSCTNSSEQVTSTTDSTAVHCDSMCVDSSACNVDSACVDTAK
jgi:hypothetical protein